MARAAIRRRLIWQLGTVEQVLAETDRTASIVLRVPDWPGHRAGQHVDVRLTAEDGYRAQRSYSIASAPDEEAVVLTVERLEDGEVSSYLVGELRAGDELELRGPIGGYFVWEEAMGGPLMLIAGGSGIVPLRAMLRHRLARKSVVPVRLLYSARSHPELIYREELRKVEEEAGVDIRLTLTREQPAGWQGYDRRIDRGLIAEVAWPPAERPLAYICGPTSFVEAAADALVSTGYEPSRVRTERFGPTGR